MEPFGRHTLNSSFPRSCCSQMRGRRSCWPPVSRTQTKSTFSRHGSVQAQLDTHGESIRGRPLSTIGGGRWTKSSNIEQLPTANLFPDVVGWRAAGRARRSRRNVDARRPWSSARHSPVRHAHHFVAKVHRSRAPENRGIGCGQTNVAQIARRFRRFPITSATVRRSDQGEGEEEIRNIVLSVL